MPSPAGIVGVRVKTPPIRTALFATVLAAVFLLQIPGVPANPPEDRGAPDCPGYRYERGLGDVCPRDNGLLEVFHPGTHHSVGFTHGLDPAPSGGEPGSPAGPKPPNCVSGAAGTYHIKVFYARAYNDVDNYASTVATIRSLVDQANGLVNDAAIATGGAASLNVKCTSGVVDVVNVVLPTGMASASFSTIVTDMNNMGYTDGKVKHWVFYDDTGACSCGGTGHVYNDDTLAVSNLNNGNGVAFFAVDFGYNSARIMMHEMGHNLGAVQDSAPHSTLAGHCYDGLDTMCYNDGGPNGGLYSTSYCGIEIFDCGKNDYFHINPTSGSYLATHWNLGNTMNRFIAFGRPTMTTLNCPTPVLLGTAASCTFMAVDDSSGVFYNVNWGDGATTRVPTSGYVSPGTTQSASHTYATTGARTVSVTATDNGGLVSPALTTVVSTVVDSTAPVTTLVDPKNNWVYSGCQAVNAVSSGRPVFVNRGCAKATITDPESAVAEVRLYFAGALKATWSNPTGSQFNLEFDVGTPATQVELRYEATNVAGLTSVTTILVTVAGA